MGIFSIVQNKTKEHCEIASKEKTTLITRDICVKKVEVICLISNSLSLKIFEELVT